MTSRLEGPVVDSGDPRKLAEFWCAALGYLVYADNGHGYVEIGADPEAPDRDRLDRLRQGPGVPNLLHFDIAPIDGDQDTELARLIGLGAKRVDVAAESVTLPGK